MKEIRDAIADQDAKYQDQMKKLLRATISEKQTQHDTNQQVADLRMQIQNQQRTHAEQVWDATSRAMHFRFAEVKTNADGRPYVRGEEVLAELGDPRDDLDMTPTINPYITPVKKPKKSVQFHTPAPGMTDKYYTTKNLEDELLDFKKLDEKYRNRNRKQYQTPQVTAGASPSMATLNTSGYFGSSMKGGA